MANRNRNIQLKIWVTEEERKRNSNKSRASTRNSRSGLFSLSEQGARNYCQHLFWFLKTNKSTTYRVGALGLCFLFFIK